MAKERKREDKRAGNEWEGRLSEKENYPGRGVPWQLWRRRQEIMKTRRGCGTRLRQRESQERGIRPFSLFLDVVDADRTMSSELPFRSRDVTALFFLVIRERNRRNSDEFNFSCCRKRETRRNVSRARIAFSLSRINIEIACGISNVEILNSTKLYRFQSLLVYTRNDSFASVLV